MHTLLYCLICSQKIMIFSPESQILTEPVQLVTDLDNPAYITRPPGGDKILVTDRRRFEEIV